MITQYLNKKVHFIGVGGISLSALAKLMIEFGATVSGSDSVDSEMLTELKSIGADIWVGSHPECINADIAVFSSAIQPDDPELVFVKKNCQEVYERHDFLGQVSALFDKVIAISGTHGKTTTTAMVTAIFKQAEKRFTAHIGGDAVGYSNMVICGDEYFITEACEFKRSFLKLKPDIAVVLNIESDHMDCFKSEPELRSAFSAFVLGVKDGGVAVVKSGYEDICKDVQTVTFTNDSAEFQTCAYGAEFKEDYDIVENKFDIIENGKKLCEVKLNIHGAHNALNAVCACAVARLCNISVSDIKDALEGFQGVKRRFERTGSVNGAKIIFDYAHHPSEIAATITVARKMFKRLAVIFQPHTYSRTKTLLGLFTKCFKEADSLSILPTYSAREKESEGMNADRLFVELLCHHDKDAVTSRYNKLDGLCDAAFFIEKMSREYDCFLLLGAGDIINVDKLLKYDK